MKAIPVHFDDLAKPALVTIFKLADLLQTTPTEAARLYTIRRTLKKSTPTQTTTSPH